MIKLSSDPSKYSFTVAIEIGSSIDGSWEEEEEERQMKEGKKRKRTRSGQYMALAVKE